MILTCKIIDIVAPMNCMNAGNASIGDTSAGNTNAGNVAIEEDTIGILVVDSTTTRAVSFA